MAQAYVVGGGGGGVGSEELTATANNVLKGNTYVGADTNDDIGTGTLELTGNATAADVASGKTFYSNNPHSRQTGSLALSGNATAGNVLNGATFYNNTFTKQTGNMPNNNAWGGSVGRNESLKVPAGYHNGNGVVTGPAMEDKGPTTYHVGTVDQTIIGPGVYTTGNQVLSKATAYGLDAGNIATGARIYVSNGATNLWDVTGTYNGLGNAEPGDVRSGRYFSTATHSNVMGTIPDFEGVTVSPGTAPITVNTAGRYATGNVIVNAIPPEYKIVGSTTSFFELGGKYYNYIDDNRTCPDYWIFNNVRNLREIAIGQAVDTQDCRFPNVVISRPLPSNSISRVDFSIYTWQKSYTIEMNGCEVWLVGWNDGDTEMNKASATWPSFTEAIAEGSLTVGDRERQYQWLAVMITGRSDSGSSASNVMNNVVRIDRCDGVIG